MAQKVREKNLGDVITFLGKVSEEEANRYIHFADCAYLSFKKNKLFDMTLPAKLQSYLACGTPVLAAAGGESARLIEEAQCGFVCAQDADELVNLINREVLLSDKTDEMRVNAKKYFDDHFTVKRIIDSLETMMTDKISERELKK